MKKNIFPLALILCLTFLLIACEQNAAPASGGSPNATTAAAPASNDTFPKEEAEKLIKKLATQDGCKDSTAEMHMSFTDKDGQAQQMDFRLQRKYDGAKIATLMTVLAPKEETEKALLAFEADDKPTEAISYLPGMKKIAKLKSDSPANFRGSKSTVQESLNLELGKYNVTAASKNKDGVQIELQAKDGLSFAYPKIVANFAADAATLQSFTLFDEHGEKRKTIIAREVKAVQNRPTIMQMEIEDHKFNQKLNVQTRNIKYDTNLASTIFTEENLIKIITAANQKLVN